MWRPGDNVGNSSSGVPYFGFSDRVSHWAWSLLSWLGWLASESLGFVCLCLPSAGVTGTVTTTPDILGLCWESHSGLCACKASNWQTMSSPQLDILDTEWTHRSLPCSLIAPARALWKSWWNSTATCFPDTETQVSVCWRNCNMAINMSHDSLKPFLNPTLLCTRWRGLGSWVTGGRTRIEKGSFRSSVCLTEWQLWNQTHEGLTQPVTDLAS